MPDLLASRENECAAARLWQREAALSRGRSNRAASHSAVAHPALPLEPRQYNVKSRCVAQPSKESKRSCWAATEAAPPFSPSGSLLVRGSTVLHSDPGMFTFIIRGCLRCRCFSRDSNRLKARLDQGITVATWKRWPELRATAALLTVGKLRTFSIFLKPKNEKIANSTSSERKKYVF